MSSASPFPDASWDDQVAAPTTQHVADTLIVWLSIADPGQASAFLARHGDLLCHPASRALLARWITHAPDDLAPAWQARLLQLRAGA